MDLHHAVGGDATEEVGRVGAVVAGVDAGVVHVEQEPRAAPREDLVQEVGLVHLRRARVGVPGDVLDGDRQAEGVLEQTHAVSHHTDGLAGERERQEVVEVRAVHGDEAEVVAMPGRPRRLQEGAQRPQEGRVRRLGVAEAEAEAVGDHWEAPPSQIYVDVTTYRRTRR